MGPEAVGVTKLNDSVDMGDVGVVLALESGDFAPDSLLAVPTSDVVAAPLPQPPHPGNQRWNKPACCCSGSDSSGAASVAETASGDSFMTYKYFVHHL